MRFLQVTGWPKFQHYRDRKPVWIKLYLSLHEKWEWMSLPDHVKGHLVGIWLLVAQVGNRLPWDPRFISNKIGATEPVTDEELQLLCDREFLVPVEANAPVLLARTPILLAEPERASKTGAKPEETDRFASPPPYNPPPQETRDKRPETPPYPPAGGAPATLAKAAAKEAVERLVEARVAAGQVVPRRLRRWLYEQLQAGRTEAALTAEWEAERDAVERETAAAERIRKLIARAESSNRLLDQVLAAVRPQVPDHTFAMWFSPLRDLGLIRDDEGERLLVGVPNDQFNGWIARNYRNVIGNACEAIGRPNLGWTPIVVPPGEERPP